MHIVKRLRLECFQEVEGEEKQKEENSIFVHFWENILIYLGAGFFG